MNIKKHPTRVPFLAYANIAPNLWRVIDTEGNPNNPIRAVGPMYRTKAELLADFDRYARETWNA